MNPEMGKTRVTLVDQTVDNCIPLTSRKIASIAPFGLSPRSLTTISGLLAPCKPGCILGLESLLRLVPTFIGKPLDVGAVTRVSGLKYTAVVIESLHCNISEDATLLLGNHRTV